MVLSHKLFLQQWILWRQKVIWGNMRREHLEAWVCGTQNSPINYQNKSHENSWCLFVVHTEHPYMMIEKFPVFSKGWCFIVSSVSGGNYSLNSVGMMIKSRSSVGTMKPLFPMRKKRYKTMKGTLGNRLHSDLLNKKGMLRFRDLAAVSVFWRKFTLVARNLSSV